MHILVPHFFGVPSRLLFRFLLEKRCPRDTFSRKKKEHLIIYCSVTDRVIESSRKATKWTSKINFQSQDFDLFNLTVSIQTQNYKTCSKLGSSILTLKLSADASILKDGKYVRLNFGAFILAFHSFLIIQLFPNWKLLKAAIRKMWP